jgi:hypothetical protein
VSENFFRKYSIPLGGPGLTVAAYALPKDLGLTSLSLGLSAGAVAAFKVQSASNLPDRGVGSSVLEPISRDSGYDIA